MCLSVIIKIYIIYMCEKKKDIKGKESNIYNWENISENIAENIAENSAE